MSSLSWVIDIFCIYYFIRPINDFWSDDPISRQYQHQHQQALKIHGCQSQATKLQNLRCENFVKSLIVINNCMFWLITQELGNLLKFRCHFWVSQTICMNVGAYIIFQNSVNNFEPAHKTCSILVWGAVPP